MKQVAAVACLSILAVVPSVWSQSALPTAGFVVASVKPSDPATTGTSYGISPNGSFSAKGVTVSILIENSYDIRRFQIVGEPGWLDTERYDIATEIDNGVPEGDPRRATTAGRQAIWDQLMAKVQVLLADRFQLKVHRETKEMSAYALVIANGGSKLRPPKPGEPGSLNIQRDDSGNMVVSGTWLPLSSLMRYMSGQVGRPIVDQTGLTGDTIFR